MTWTKRNLCCVCVLLFVSASVLYAIINVGFALDLRLDMLVLHIPLVSQSAESYEDWCVRELRGCGSKFGPERGDYSFTLVTGFLDIGRGDWWTQGRSYREYLSFLLKILQLDVNLVIFIEEKGRNFVNINRRGRENRTVIYPVTLQSLPYYSLLPRIQNIMDSADFKKNNANYEKGKCEALIPLYNLVTNSKIGLVHEAIRENPFSSDYFVWMDGGYGHGETEETGIFPPDGIWSPGHLLTYPDQVTFTALQDLPAEGERPRNMYKMDKTWIAGGLYGGGIQAMETYHRLHELVFLDYLNNGMVDDDQTIFLEAFLQNRSNFRPVRGSWYDLMRGTGFS